MDDEGRQIEVPIIGGAALTVIMQRFDGYAALDGGFA
jgi:hypothetical protein